MIRRAIISVSYKTGIADFARKLVELNVEILSTGGTAKLLEKEGIPCKEVSEITGFPECLDGRVKTLHPLIHGGILAMRGNPEHMKRVEELGIGNLTSSADLLISLGEEVNIFRGERDNIKVTTPEDLYTLRSHYYYEHFKRFADEEFHEK